MMILTINDTIHVFFYFSKKKWNKLISAQEIHLKMTKNKLCLSRYTISLFLKQLHKNRRANYNYDANTCILY